MIARTTLALLLLTLPAAAQGPWSAFFSTATTTPTPTYSLLDEANASAHAARSVDDRELVPTGHAWELRPVERVHLESGADALPAYDTLPGGVVLGHGATPTGHFDGARLELRGKNLFLVRADGIALQVPAGDIESTCAALAFAMRAEPSEVVVDIRYDGVRLAPEFAGTRWAEVVERADRAPQAHLSKLIGYKTMIVDRAVGFEQDPQVPGRLRLSANLEIRAYRPHDTLYRISVPHRVASIVVERSDDGSLHATGVPDSASAAKLVADLEPLSELAALVGFFRWARLQDPAGLADLRGALDRLAADEEGAAFFERFSLAR